VSKMFLILGFILEIFDEYDDDGDEVISSFIISSLCEFINYYSYAYVFNACNRLRMQCVVLLCVVKNFGLFHNLNEIA
jgi:hypothetical protein